MSNGHGDMDKEETEREREGLRERERWAKKEYETQYEFIIYLPSQ